MQALVLKIQNSICELINELYQLSIRAEDVMIQQTKPEFEGQFTFVTFSLIKELKKSPELFGQELGDALLKKHKNLISNYNVVKGFLNLSIQEIVFIDWLKNNDVTEIEPRSQSQSNIMVEYSSPNTNKPLHFGHLRNIFLGDAISKILKANKYNVTKANLINDRGIHICKSMLAWQKWGMNATPESLSKKGDHLVGDFYVMFDQQLNQEFEESKTSIFEGTFKLGNTAAQEKYQELYQAFASESNINKKEELKKAIIKHIKNFLPLMDEARNMLVKWENKDKEVYTLWERMNGWVYEGFDQTYKAMGISFDKVYYESNTYSLGKDVVMDGLKRNVLFQKEDNSIWVDLEEFGLDQKLLLRGDGTSVYITQDLGTAILKNNEFKLNKSIYVIADEQNYHMKVLQATLRKLKEPAADVIHHLSYGMVELPSGKMKSREGNVVDADDMIQSMIDIAISRTNETGKANNLEESDKQALYKMIGLGAIKFFLLRVNPKKKMLFNPEESIDMNGFTATAIQYAHARICSIFRKLDVDMQIFNDHNLSVLLNPLELSLLLKVAQYKTVLQQSALEYDASLICNYIYELVKIFNSFYDQCSIANADNQGQQNLRLLLCKNTATIIKHGMNCLGIDVPEKM